MLKSRLVQWVEQNRVIVTVASVAGSFAGLLFSIADLKGAIEKHRRKKKAPAERAR